MKLRKATGIVTHYPLPHPPGSGKQTQIRPDRRRSQIALRRSHRSRHLRAVESIRHWRSMMGRETYPKARQSLITVDSGGSNGPRARLWKLHFPPGSSKWKRLQRRLFSFTTKNWRGKPLLSHEVIVSLIAATTIRTGLRVHSQLDTGKYPKEIKVGKRVLAAIQLYPYTFPGEWNYTPYYQRASG